MPETRELLSEEQMHRIEELARYQNRTPTAIVREAVNSYLDDQTWVEFVKSNERLARARRISEDDVDRLIAEYRREKAGLES